MRFVIGGLVVATFFAPLAAFAFPFGGQITVYHVCYNETIFARLSPPVPGDYVWTRSTKTYQFGPPRAVGQWLLGLTSIPYDCLWSINPIYVQPAIAIMMMGSSGGAAPPVSAPPVTPPAATPAPGGGQPRTPAEWCQFYKDNPTAPPPTVDPCLQ